MKIDELCYYLYNEMSTRIFYPFNFMGLQINPPPFVGNKQTLMYNRGRTGSRPEDRQEEGNF